MNSGGDTLGSLTNAAQASWQWAKNNPDTLMRYASRIAPYAGAPGSRGPLATASALTELGMYPSREQQARVYRRDRTNELEGSPQTDLTGKPPLAPRDPDKAVEAAFSGMDVTRDEAATQRRLQAERRAAAERSRSGLASRSVPLQGQRNQGNQGSPFAPPQRQQQQQTSLEAMARQLIERRQGMGPGGTPWFGGSPPPYWE